MLKHPLLCLHDKCVFPLQELIHDLEKDKLEDMVVEKDVHRFHKAGVPMVLVKEKKRYESDDKDHIFESYESSMIPEEIYNEFIEKMHAPKKKRSPKSAKKRKNKKDKRSRKMRKSQKSE
jgi:hypothetical protein